MTARHKYIYAPALGGRRGATPDYGASGRHPALKSLEQLYSMVDDPGEVNEQIAAHALLSAAPIAPTENQTAASAALAAMRA
eukprot:3284443-Prymnesium_polylepis.2